MLTHNYNFVGCPNTIVELILTRWLECFLALLTEAIADTVSPSITQRLKTSMSTSSDASSVVNDQTACSNRYMLQVTTPANMSAGLGSSDGIGCRNDNANSSIASFSGARASANCSSNVSGQEFITEFVH